MYQKCCWSELLGGCSSSFLEDVLKVIIADIDKVEESFPSCNSLSSWDEAQYNFQMLLFLALSDALVHTLLGGLKLGAQPPELRWKLGLLDLSIKLLNLRSALTDVALDGSPTHTAARLFRHRLSHRLSHRYSSGQDLIHRDFLSFLGCGAHGVHLCRHLLSVVL